jgi:5-methylcytosine-specific restriction protein A
VSGGWAGRSATDRHDELPADWPAIRAEVLDRDGHRCTWKLPSGNRCPNGATDVDHIGDKNNHDKSNLRSLCSAHHDKRTAIQGAKEAAARRALPPRRRASRQHPSTGWR